MNNSFVVPSPSTPDSAREQSGDWDTFAQCFGLEPAAKALWMKHMREDDAMALLGGLAISADTRAPDGTLDQLSARLDMMADQDVDQDFSALVMQRQNATHRASGEFDIEDLIWLFTRSQEAQKMRIERCTLQSFVSGLVSSMAKEVRRGESLHAMTHVIRLLTGFLKVLDTSPTRTQESQHVTDSSVNGYSAEIRRLEEETQSHDQTLDDHGMMLHMHEALFHTLEEQVGKLAEEHHKVEQRCNEAVERCQKAEERCRKVEEDYRALKKDFERLWESALILSP
ncbi:hypothetical protein Micbo1qcDRAFT_225048 [Microdochium bolleyi]|uniref:Uncharacterized protein n=1 Tax=Microdochium bolleyi TaxID=196109 RepID=A0A136J1W3_9PEZI|nr:hypothetical protein Micbo1qcDRAFT_225048 [Microdochium bolleyi]